MISKMPMPLRLERTDHLKQRLNFVCIQAGGGFVEDQDFRRHIDAARNGDNLLNGNGIRGQGSGHINIEIIGFEQRFCSGIDLRVC